VTDIVMRPADFARQSLASIDASEGRRRRRKRDTTPDRIGLDIKRTLLFGTAESDPSPSDYEGWLLGQVITSPAPGAVRALAAELLDEYRLASADPQFHKWLAEGAPSDDADQ
jgi:hypothetical protein